tara:strand:+ start:216 stop:1187 length:972 start_codon:yes stop_codon:yes gene_type:complete
VKNIAIIGAGMTGLSLAYNLKEHNISIFDKSWRPGGRVSTRKHGSTYFDHGAHYLSINHHVKQLRDILNKLNIVKEKEIIFSTDFLKNEIIKKKVLIGNNGMTSIPKKIFEDLNIKGHFNSKIIKITKKDNKYSLFSNDEEFTNFDFVLISIPFIQAKELSQEFIDFNKEHEPKYDPIYTVMLSYDKSNNINLDGGLNLHKDISFFMKQNFKFSNLDKECWVFNLTSEYTENNLNIDKEKLEEKVIKVFENSFEISQKPIYQNSHRWLYAQTKITYNSLSKKNWIGSKDSSIFLSGDWVTGKSLSDAWDSGQKLSNYIKLLAI